MSLIKTKKEIGLLQEGGKILAEILYSIKDKVLPGVTTRELSDFAEKSIILAGGNPSFKDYGEDPPFPSGLCVSVNEELVHGIPGDRVLQNGDIVGLDIGMQYPANGGLFTDTAITVGVGKISKEDDKLIKVTKRALDIWIENLHPGANLNKIAQKVQKYVQENGYSIVRELVGHGVGHAVHEDPPIANYYIPGDDFIVRSGMVLAFEPMVSLGGFRIKTLSDGWTIVIADGSRCAHFEHTVAITDSGIIVITKK